MSTTETIRWNQETDGPLSADAMTIKFERMGYRASVYVYPPGTTFPDHTHGIDKLDGVVSGRFRIRMNGLAVDLNAGDCIAVPAGWIHSAEVIGPEPVVSVDGVRKR